MGLKYVVRTPDQLPQLIPGFRKQSGFTQAQVALRMGITQQAYSALERNSERISAANLLKVLNVLKIDLYIAQRAPLVRKRKATGLDKPEW